MNITGQFLTKHEVQKIEKLITALENWEQGSDVYAEVALIDINGEALGLIKKTNQDRWGFFPSADEDKTAKTFLQGDLIVGES